VNINNTTINNIHNNWTNVINRPGNPGWYRPRPGWTNHWNQWGNNVRRNWHHNHWHNNWFRDSWWVGRWGNWGGWHYGFRWGYHPWSYWWTVPVWNNLNSWFVWGTPGAATWQQPIYYDYGPGGNVVFQNDAVYIGGEQVASANDFAMSAATLATVEPPETEEQAEAAEWMPLGTFAVSTSEKETDPSRIMQLAVSREGIISGTLYNTLTDQTQEIQGKVDQRHAVQHADRPDARDPGQGRSRHAASRVPDRRERKRHRGDGALQPHAERGAVVGPLRHGEDGIVLARAARSAGGRRSANSTIKPRPLVACDSAVESATTGRGFMGAVVLSNAGSTLAFGGSRGARFPRCPSPRSAR
jgi:hypothetical protein